MRITDSTKFIQDVQVDILYNKDNTNYYKRQKYHLNIG